MVNAKDTEEDFRIYDSGKRLVHSLNVQTLIGEGSVVFNFYLIGDFNSMATKSPQFIYGCNELSGEKYGLYKPFELREIL